jgi:hypothetical protein
MKSRSCLCGFVFGHRDKPVVCGQHHEDLKEENQSLKRQIEELRAEVQRLSQIAQY